MLLHQSDPAIPSLVPRSARGAGKAPFVMPRGLPGMPDEFAEGSTRFAPARAGVLRTAGSVAVPMPLPSMYELASIARAVAGETSLSRAAITLQQSVCRLLRVTDAMCVWIDWPRRIAMSATGRVSSQVEELVLDVAGSGKRATLGSSIVQPIGRPPARAVLALRKSTGMLFAADEIALISTLAAGIAPALDRLVLSGRP